MAHALHVCLAAHLMCMPPAAATRTALQFGVAAFLIAGSAHAGRSEMYGRFYEAFSRWGEPCIPIDQTFMESSPFLDLLDRLRQHAAEYERDHWVQCRWVGALHPAAPCRPPTCASLAVIMGSCPS
jgi:hypothetical protein